MAPAGRPRFGKQLKKRYNVMLEPKIAEHIRGIGLGNLSAGIQRLVSLDLENGVKQANAKERGTARRRPSNQ